MVEKVEGNTALIIVDVQMDFCPGGALAVPEGDQVVPMLNEMIKDDFRNDPEVIFASRDWHPRVTKHFSEFGGQWPVHCVEYTEGAGFHPDLKLPEGTTIISKGEDPEKDAYSAFDGVTEHGVVSLEEELKRRGITTLYVGGLATDYCVKASVLHALKRGFTVFVKTAACRAVNLSPNDGQKAIEEMEAAGAQII